MCSIGGVVDMPLNAKQAVFMQTLGDANTNNDTYRLYLSSETGAGVIIDISGLVYRKFGVQGMWTVVSDLSNAQVVGSAASRHDCDGSKEVACVKGAAKEGVFRPMIIDLPTTTEENDDIINASSSKSREHIRIDGIVAAAAYSYIIVGKDGAARLFDSRLRRRLRPLCGASIDGKRRIR